MAKIYIYIFLKDNEGVQTQTPPQLNYYMDKLMFKRCIYINCLIGLH